MADVAATPLREVLETFRSDGIDRVKIGSFDIDGVFRGKYVGLEKAMSSLESGLGFCDVIFGWDCRDALLDNLKTTGWHTGYPDLVGRIDPQTCRRVPWEQRVPLFLLDFFNPDGSEFEIAPRNVLRRVLGRAKRLGFEPLMSCEYEFVIFRETASTLSDKHYHNLLPLSPSGTGYSILRASAASQLVDDLIRGMREYDLEIEGFHTETGPGVFEAAIRYDRALIAADKAALFKTAVKEVAGRHGLMASFMAKWNADRPGCGGHIHQSLVSLETGQNVFHEEAGKARMSHVFEQYVGGLMATMGDLMPMVAPTINSYKRTVPGTWAPTTITWAIENRTSGLRVIPGTKSSTRLEFRLSGADINPYLAFSACLAGGLHGVENALEVPPPIQGNAYHSTAALPKTLEEANANFRSSQFARDWFGNTFVDHFAATRDWEVRQFHKAVTDWELERYFETI